MRHCQLNVAFFVAFCSILWPLHVGKSFFKRVSAIINSRDKMRNCQLNVAFFGHCMLGKRFWGTVFGRPFVGDRLWETVSGKPLCWRIVFGKPFWETVFGNRFWTTSESYFPNIVFQKSFFQIDMSHL